MAKKIKLKAMPGVVLIEYASKSDQVIKNIVGKASILMAKPKHEGIPDRGIVLAVGYGVDEIKVGDDVQYSVDSPEGFHWDGIKIIAVKAEDVIAIWHE